MKFNFTGAFIKNNMKIWYETVTTKNSGLAINEDLTLEYFY